MDISALTKLVAAVREQEPSRRIIIFGSSALLVSLKLSGDAALGTETTLDVDFLLDPDDQQMREVLDDSLGSDSAYEIATGFHGDFVDARIANDFFPRGWRDRLVPLPGFDTVFALGTCDTAAAKLFATAFSRLNRRMGRNSPDRGQKDIRTVAALLRADLIKRQELASQIESVPLPPPLMLEANNALIEAIAAAEA